MRLRLTGFFLAALIILSAAAERLHAQATANSAERLISSPLQIWELPSDQKNREHALRIEGRVSVYDPYWRIFWLENEGVGTYVLLAHEKAPPMRYGQWVRIEGSIIPNEGLNADRVRVTVLKDFIPVKAIPAEGRIMELEALNCRIISTRGYVDSQQLIDDDHLRLNMIIDDRPVVGWVKPLSTTKLPEWEGNFIRVTAMYAGRLDPSGTRSLIELWISGPDAIESEGPLASHPSFKLERTSIRNLHSLRPDTVVKITGNVIQHNAGNTMTVRDETGQVQVSTMQRTRVPLGTRVDVLGRVAPLGQVWTIRHALYRISQTQSPELDPGKQSIRSIDTLHHLSLSEAAEKRPVSIAGMVTWSYPEADHFFLQDQGAGIRVFFSPNILSSPSLQKYLRVEGVTTIIGDTISVELQSYTDLGSMGAPTAKMRNYDQVVSGIEDAQWIEMRGFLQRVVSDGESRWIHVTTPNGPFVGHLKSPINLDALPGSLIRMRGVCETRKDKQGKVNSVILRVPFLHDITVEENAPADPFQTRLYPVEDLHEVRAMQDMIRVRVEGVVQHAERGHVVYLKGKTEALTVLSGDTLPLQPGDRVEAVGILGNEGARILLREASLRKTGVEAAPLPQLVAESIANLQDADGLLVRVQGELRDKTDVYGETRLTLLSKGSYFEATAATPEAGAPELPDLGSKIELTGICVATYDDHRKARGFSLITRTPADIVVIEGPPFWTKKRVLIILSVLFAFCTLPFAWVYALRRRVRRQTEQIRRQMEKQAALESSLQQAEKLESLGLLAGGIAHDYNNLLTTIIANLSLAKHDEIAQSCVGENLSEALKSAYRAKELTQQLLTFSKGGAPLRAPTDLAVCVRQAADLILHDTRIRCHYQNQGELWSALVDRNQFAQVVHNLILNAKEAMSGVGEIRISLANEELGEANDYGIPSGQYVKMSLQDSGRGIDPVLLSRIFDPYFTTKEAGKGLGLATAYSIIKKHGGVIRVFSQPGAGALFEVLVPAAGKAPAPAAPRAAAAGAPVPEEAGTKSVRVLVMDDDESIRRVVSIILRRLKLEPALACDGTEAIQLFVDAKKQGKPFALLIFDLTVPGRMGGRETMEIIRGMDTQVPAIVSSGYSNDPVMAKFREHGFQACVQKPYEIEELVTKIREVMSSPTELKR